MVFNLVFYLAKLIERLNYKIGIKRYDKKLNKEIELKVTKGIYDSKFKVNDNLYMVNVGCSIENLQGGWRFYSGKTGFIDAADNFLTQMKYDSAFAYKSNFGGLIEVSIKDSGSGIIDDNGIEVLQCLYNVNHLNCGLWIVEKNNKYGIVNEKGLLKTPVKYDKISFGMYFKTEDMLVLDEVGNCVGESCFCVQIDVKVGLVDVNGIEILPITYDYLTVLSKCYMIAKTENDTEVKYSLIDKNGEIIISPTINKIIKLSEILISIEENGKFKVALMTGQVVSPRQYDDIQTNDSYGNFINVCVNEKWGLSRYLSVHDHEKYDNDIEYIINHKGWEDLLPPIFDGIESVIGSDSTSAIVRVGSKYGSYEFSNKKCCTDIIYDTPRQARDAGANLHNTYWKKWFEDNNNGKNVSS